MSKTDSAGGRLKGIIVPLITPLKAQDEIDHGGLERLLEHVLSGGVAGIFILGTSGEAPSLSYKLRRDLIASTCRIVKTRSPVLVGITDTCLTEALELARRAADAGARAVVSSAPYYVPVGQPELIEYFECLVRDLPLPLFLYNMPQMTKVRFEPETLRHLSALEGIIGVKDSSGDLAYFARVLELKRVRADWSVFVGPEHLLLETAGQGGDGGVNGGANFYPRLFVDLFNAFESGDRGRANELQQELLRLGKVYQIGRHASTVIKGMKCACSLLGLCDDLMAEPFQRFNAPERERVRAVLESVGLFSWKAGAG
jgi:dihydrodipicolinate synthase/N-acetylneuraminate lyase